METKINLYVFWKYDLFPYVLGSAATKMKDDGRVYVPNYQGWVRPVKIVPIEEGERISKQIQGIEKERKEEEIKFQKKWDEKISIVLG